MSRYAYGGDPPGMAGKYHYGVGSIGIPGSLIAADGFMGQSVTLPADADKEYYAVIPVIPAGLTFDDGEAGDFDASAPDGTYVMPWDFYEWGVKLGSTSTTFKFGTGTAINLAISNMSMASTLSTLNVGVSPPGAGVVNLSISNLRIASTLSTIVVTSVPPANPGNNSIVYTLTSRDNVPRVGLNGLEWALFAQLKPSLFGAPIAKGSLETTDGSAVLLIQVPANTVPIGSYFLVLTDANGSLALAAVVSVQ